MAKPDFFLLDYGIPQSRKRLVLLASKFGKINLIPATHRPELYKTVRQTIEHLQPLSAGQASKIDLLHRSSKLSELNLRRIRASKPGGTWRDWPKVSFSATLPLLMRSNISRRVSSSAFSVSTIMRMVARLKRLCLARGKSLNLKLLSCFSFSSPHSFSSLLRNLSKVRIRWVPSTISNRAKPVSGSEVEKLAHALKSGGYVANEAALDLTKRIAARRNRQKAANAAQ